LGIEPIKNLAHQLESLLDAARRDELPITRTVIELILAGGDVLQKYVDAIARQLGGVGRGERIVVPTAALLDRVKACLDGGGAASAPVPPTPASPITQALDDLAAGAHTLAAARHPVPAQVAAPAVAPAPASAPVAPTLMIAPAAPLVVKPVAAQPAATPIRATDLASYVKLDTRKLDALVDLMGELVIAQSMVVQHPLVQQQDDRELERHLRQLSRITTELQHNAMSLRMVPIRSVFQKMTRLVRDLAAAQNKQVQLHLSGEDTELDRNIVEELADPLLHMMRNAVDHGIEAPADRVAKGKSPQGNIYLHAAHQGGGILIRMRDDGQGLNAQKILHKALQRGLVSADNPPSESDIYNLIFLPGFSTADTVTDISGRGVGMDVVRGGINTLRGRIDIESVPGEGTTFNIYLPLTLAIIDGMLVGVGSERFILPTLTIRESLRPQPGMVFTVQGKGEVISVRSKLIPLVRLSDKLGIHGTTQDPCEGIVMVVDSGARTRALLVDSLIGKQEVVIKSLGDTFKHHKGMSGAAIMGDGRVALIIDPDAVSQLPSAHALAA
jgi:two-component system chemotaxis sensor kinase CheA